MPQTLTITNFGGPLTRRPNGDINSGLAKFDTSWGYDPYSSPGNLRWNEQPSSVYSASSIQGALTTAKKEISGSTTRIFAAKRFPAQLLRFTLDNTSGEVQSSSVISALAGAMTSDDGADMVFFGTNNRIFISNEASIQKVDTDGTDPSVIGTTSSLISFVPRPMAEFLGKIYFGNGNNIGEIDSTELLTTGTKLSPGLPSDVTIQDMEVTPDGNYLQITATIGDHVSAYLTPKPKASRLTSSYQFLWNGIDDTYSAFSSYLGQAFLASISVGNSNYSFGYEPSGGALYKNGVKILSMPGVNVQYFPALFPLGNSIGMLAVEKNSDSTGMNLSLFYYGQYDEETPEGLYRLLEQSSESRTDFITAQWGLVATNLQYAPSYEGDSNGQFGSSQILFHTIESSSDVSQQYIDRVWNFNSYPTGTGSILAGVYETQTQLFSKRVAVKEVRVYTDPLAGGNDFEVDLIGSGGSVLSGGSAKFAVGTNPIVAGQDMVQYNPQSAPTYAVGVRITNASVTGVRNWTATKVELDYEDAGK